MTYYNSSVQRKIPFSYLKNETTFKRIHRFAGSENGHLNAQRELINTKSVLGCTRILRVSESERTIIFHREIKNKKKRTKRAQKDSKKILGSSNRLGRILYFLCAYHCNRLIAVDNFW